MKREIFRNADSIVTWVDGAFSDSSNTTRNLNDMVIWRNLCYYCGDQWIEYSPVTKSFRSRQRADFVPTPVDNEIREYVRSVKSMLMNQKFVPRVWPNTNEREDIQAAELGEKLPVWMDESNDQRFA